MNKKAEQFYKRSKNAQTSSQRLLCLYNAFYVLYCNDACSKIADLLSIDYDTVKTVIECSVEDYEGIVSSFTEKQIELLDNYLSSLL